MRMRHEFVPTGANVELCEGCAAFVNVIKQPVGKRPLSWAMCHQISSESASACGRFST